MIDKNKFKEKLVKLRRGVGLSQNDLASVLQVSSQAVSKWENALSLPDIELLLPLAEALGVSIDYLIRNNTDRGEEKDHMGYNPWDTKMEYLKKTRTALWNDDYFEFLVKKVWHLDQPLNIIDFGCGYGDIGIRLLPLLAQGSTYTGIDTSKVLLEEAERLFFDSPYNTEFIHEDFNQFSTSKKYDIAICQAVLRHLPNPKNILVKMADVVKTGGMVICIEVNRELENAGLYIDGLEETHLERTVLLQKQWQTEYHGGGRDHKLGIKVPVYMQEIGLHNVSVRINDCVGLINPDDNRNEYQKQFSSFITTSGWGITEPPDKESCVNNLMAQGLTQEEALTYITCENKITRYLQQNKDSVFVINTRCLLVSFGTK